MPFPVPSAIGLAMTGNGKLTPIDVVQLRDDMPIGRRHAGRSHDRFRQRLVETHGEHRRVGRTCTEFRTRRESPALAIRGPPAQAFADVEHKVPAVAVRQPLDETSRMADAIGRVAELLQRAVDRLDRAELIELGGLLFAVAGGEVIDAQIVGEADVHGGAGSVEHGAWSQSSDSMLRAPCSVLNWIVIPVLAGLRSSAAGASRRRGR